MTDPTTDPATETDLSTAVRTAVMRLRRRLISERDPGNELSVGAMAVLGGLSYRGEMTIGELAEREHVRPPSMTRMVNALEASGDVVRRAGEADRRQVIVSITEQGRRRLAADRARRDAWLKRKLQDLTDEEREIVRRAGRILERIATS